MGDQVRPRRSDANGDGSAVTEETSLLDRQKHTVKQASYREALRDCIIGFADGLTVPFALMAGLSTLGSSRLVILGGLGELFAGSISMGLGAYLAVSTEQKQYVVEEAREFNEVQEQPEAEEQQVYHVLAKYGLDRQAIKPVVDGLKVNPDMWVKFMMDFELKLEKPAPSRSWMSPLAMGLSYFLGGLIPMLPYFAIDNVLHALFVSIAIAVCVLLAFGYVKAKVSGCSVRTACASALQTLLVGVVAASASYGIVRATNELQPEEKAKGS